MSTRIPQFHAKRVVNCQNILGECPLWDERKKLICWVDIEGKKFWTFSPATNESKEYLLPERAGSFAICANSLDYYLFAFENGPAFYNYKTNTILGKRIFLFEPNKPTLLNDGRCDLNGRFIVGGRVEYKNNPKIKLNKDSNIYRINVDGTYQIIIPNISCANSICFTNNTMYMTDSRHMKCIKQYKYYSDSTIPNNPTIFTQAKQGSFDGAIIDKQGYLWNSRVNGQVVRYDKNGNVCMVVNVPERGTCCCFGGKNLDTMYITTLGTYGTPLNNKGNKNVGGLYAVQLPIKGRIENKFEGSPSSCGCLLAKL